MPKYVISGYYGFDNIGDESILMSMVAAIKGINQNIEITALSASPGVTSMRYNIKSIGRNNFLSILKEIRDCDLFISGGGSLLQDVTGWKSIPYYLGQVMFAQIMGKKTVFFAQGIGPVKNKMYRWLIKKIMSKADFISVRDNKSRNLLVNWGMNYEQIHLSVDPVFILRNMSQVDVKVKEEINLSDTSQKPLIGVSVRPWGDNNYLKNFAEALSKFAASINANVLIIPFHTGQDRDISNQLKEIVISKWKKDNYQGDIRIDKVETPLQVLNIYNKLDFLLGVRLHSLIFSVLSNVPFVAVEYDPKVAGFMELIGINSSVAINELDGDQLYRICKSIWSNRKKFNGILKQQGDLFAKLALKNVVEINKLLK